MKNRIKKHRLEAGKAQAGSLRYRLEACATGWKPALPNFLVAQASSLHRSRMNYHF
jgi:hypothetical protein